MTKTTEFEHFISIKSDCNSVGIMGTEKKLRKKYLIILLKLQHYYRWYHFKWKT